MSNDKLAIILSKYRSSLSTRAADLQTYVDTSLDEKAVEELFLKVHKLAGSAASYGFPKVSECATKLAASLKNKQHQSINQQLTVLIQAIQDKK